MAHEIGFDHSVWEGDVSGASSANAMIQPTDFTHDIHSSDFQQLLGLHEDMIALTVRVKAAIDNDLNRMGRAGISILTTDQELAQELFEG